MHVYTSHILLALCMGEHERKVPWTHLDSAWTLLQFHAFAWYHSAYRMWSDCDLMFKAGYMWSCPSLSTVKLWTGTWTWCIQIVTCKESWQLAIYVATGYIVLCTSNLT